MRRFRHVLVFAFAIAGLFSRLAAQPGTVAPSAPAEVALHRGVLPNGLSYAVLPHNSPKGDISVRLLVEVGSLDERDDERGFAHFVEHMAFNGTRNFPPEVLRIYFQQLGLRYGADLNARTSFTQTQYMLDLPEGRATSLDDSLILIRDYADGIQFLPEEVEKEKAVVLSEARARDNAATRTQTELLKALYTGTRLPEREPTGDPASIASATSEQLRSFYRRNYQPQRMTVLVVGPVDPAQIIEKISAAFASMPPAGTPVPPAPVPKLPVVAGIEPGIVVLPFAQGANVQLLAAGPRPADTVEGRRDELLRRLAMSILHVRLVALRESEIHRFGPVNASYNISPLDASVHHTLSLPTTASAWDDGIEFLETELRRARTVGFAQAEVDEAVASRLTVLRSRVSAHAGEPAESVASQLADSISAKRTWQTPEAELAEATQALEGLEAEEVTALLDRIFPADALRLFVVTPPGNAPKPERVVAAYTRSAARPLRTKARAAEELIFRYDDFGPPGQIAQRERIEDLDLTLASFANGVRLNVRPTTWEPERFRLRIVFPLNHSNISRDRGGIADLAGFLLLSSNLKRHKQSELDRLSNLRGIRPQFSVNDGTPVLTISGPAAELPFAFQFLTAVLSDLDFDTEHYRLALTRYASAHRNLLLNANALALRHAVFAYAGNDDRLLLHPPKALARVQPAETEDWLVDHVINGPLEIGLVGDVTADDAIAAAAATVGTLRKRKAAPKPGSPLAAPKKAARHQGTADLPGSVSLACVLWPVELPDNPRDNAALALATDVLRDRLIAVVREALGLSYAPATRIHRDLVQRDFAYAAMISTFETDRARQLTEASVRLAARTAERGIGEQEFANVREPARARAAADLRNNSWWLNTVVCFAQSRPEVLDTARRHGTVLDEITLADVNRAAQVFKPDRVTVMILHPTPEKDDGAKDTPKKK